MLSLSKQNSAASPRYIKRTYATIAHQNTHPEQKLEKKSLMSGTSMENLMKALKTYQNDVGPGQYDQPSLTG